MTAPVYLANNFNFLETPGETDVANTITRMIAQALALGWTNPSGNTIKTPPNSVGQFIQTAFARISATNLEMVFTDSLSRTFTRRAQTGTPFVERLYFNTYGMCFDPSNGEGLWASLLDISPELQNCHDQFCTGHGSRTAADALDGLFQTAGAEQLSSANPRAYAPVTQSILSPRGDILSAASPLGMQSFTQPGSRLWYPNIQTGPVTGTIWKIRGRVFQMLMVSGAEAAQTEIVVPVDGANTGTFKVLSFTNAATNYNGKMAMRKA